MEFQVLDASNRSRVRVYTDEPLWDVLRDLLVSIHALQPGEDLAKDLKLSPAHVASLIGLLALELLRLMESISQERGPRPHAVALEVLGERIMIDPRVPEHQKLQRVKNLHDALREAPLEGGVKIVAIPPIDSMSFYILQVVRRAGRAWYRDELMSALVEEYRRLRAATADREVIRSFDQAMARLGERPSMLDERVEVLTEGGLLEGDADAGTLRPSEKLRAIAF